MGQTIAVVSGKGGTGKTSFTANVGMALAQLGHPTLCFDCDIGLRNLDIALAMTDRAVMDFTDVLRAAMAPLYPELRRRFDYCLIDAPAGLGAGFRLALSAADRAVVVTTTDASSLRDAQRTVMELDALPRGRVHLVVNRCRKKLLKSLHQTIDDAIDMAGLPLLGVIPEDETMPLYSGRGVPLLLSPNDCAARAYRNIARRITGKRTPLMKLR